jgi:hypothetical protein
MALVIDSAMRCVALAPASPGAVRGAAARAAGFAAAAPAEDLGAPRAGGFTIRNSGAARVMGWTLRWGLPYR